jgi:hypothetical protein
MRGMYHAYGDLSHTQSVSCAGLLRPPGLPHLAGGHVAEGRHQHGARQPLHAPVGRQRRRVRALVPLLQRGGPMLLLRSLLLRSEVFGDGAVLCCWKECAAVEQVQRSLLPLALRT